MIQLNDNSIFVGHIKQLLKEFNLPKCLVGEDNATLGNHYIDNNSIYFYDPYDYQKKRICPYIFGKKYENITTNLQIRNLIYDRYTHRYLGEYLRFLRDYKHMDLMSMYNCFDEEVSTRDISFLLLSAYLDDLKIPGTVLYADIGYANFEKNYLYLYDEDKWNKLDRYDSYTSSLNTSSCDSSCEDEWADYETDHRFLQVYINCILANNLQKNLSDYILPIEKKFAGIKDGYITYSIPIKLNQTYTLSLQFNGSIETCLTFYRLENWPGDPNREGQEYEVEEILNTLGLLSYKKYIPGRRVVIRPFDWMENATSTSSDPAIPSPEYIKELVEKYNFELRLLLKLPANIKSSIALLEGDYHTTFNYNGNLPNYDEKNKAIIPNVFVYNPQLFSIIGSKNYLLADRLEEYLVNNPISILSEDYDIIKAQKYLTSVQDSTGHVYVKSDTFGTWSAKDTEAIRSRIILDPNTKLGLKNYDLIGFVDKIVEKKMTETDTGGYLV